MAYTKTELEAFKNSLLASGQPIFANMHRSQVQTLIEEMFDAQTRGDLLAGVQESADVQSDDLFFVIRNGEAFLVPLPVNPLARVTVSVSGSTITMNMANTPERVFVGSAAIGANKTLEFTNTTGACRATLHIEITGAARNLIMPAGVVRDPSLWTWSTGPLTLTLDPGKYVLVFNYDGTEWKVEISGVYTNT